jgi:hypothetical protein
MNPIKQNIIRELGTTISLRSIFEKEDGEFTRFNHSHRHNSILEYRIPEHQRFPQWKLKQKNKLIDTVMKNYTMSNLIVSQKYDKELECNYYDIEDGQSRLSILQDYISGGFSFDYEGNKYNYEDLPSDVKEKFLSYTLSIEVLKKKRGVSDKVYEYELDEMFERLQCGVPLNNDDKFWNRKSTPMVKLAIKLLQNSDLQNYFSVKKFNPQNGQRKKLSDMCALVGSVLYGSYTPSLKLQSDNIDLPINVEEEKKVIDFVTYYMDILKTSYEEVPKKEKEQFLKFYSSAKIMCVIIYDYRDTEFKNNNYKKDMWVNTINKFREFPNLLNGSSTIWNGLSNSEKQNTNEPKHIEKRVERIREFYDNKTQGPLCRKYAII